jgi:hypothetical protein
MEPYSINNIKRFIFKKKKTGWYGVLIFLLKGKGEKKW